MRSEKQNTLPSSPNRQNRARGNVKPPTLTLRRILVPLDFSGKSRQALDFALPLAEQYGGKIVLAHVVKPHAMSAWHAIPGGGHYLAMNRHNLADAAGKRLNEMAFDHVPARLRGQTFVLRGSPCAELTSLAERLKVGLIVLSTRGHTGVKRMLIGSTAERVVRHAHCSVLTVRRRAGFSSLDAEAVKKGGGRLTWRRILAPLDFSLTSLHALGVAVRLAEDSGARLHLLHVVEPTPPVAGPDGAVLAVPSPAVFERAKAYLPRLARRMVPSSVTVVTSVAQGQASKLILETANARRSDLIVLSTHGHTGLERFLLGSTAERVVRHAPCPVFVVRRRRRKDGTG